MYKPVSTTVKVCVVGLAMGSGVSPEAKHVFKVTSDIVESAESSMSLFGAKNAFISKLLALANDCANDGWDGDGALGLNLDAVFYVQAFIRALPDDMPLPEVAPEPDGSVSLDWIRSKHRLFSLSIGASNKFAYAWMNGANRSHGVFSFDGHSISPVLRESIMGVMSDGITSLRVA